MWQITRFVWAFCIFRVFNLYTCTAKTHRKTLLKTIGKTMLNAWATYVHPQTKQRAIQAWQFAIRVKTTLLPQLSYSCLDIMEMNTDIQLSFCVFSAIKLLG